MDQLKTDQLCAEICELYNDPNAYIQGSETKKLVDKKRDELLKHIISQRKR